MAIIYKSINYKTMKKIKFLQLFMLLSFVAISLVACGENDDYGSLKKSDMYGTWYASSSHSNCDKITFKRDGTYSFDGVYTSDKRTWSFDGISRTWVKCRADGHRYTNVILLLDAHTFSYTDQYGNNYVWTR